MSFSRRYAALKRILGRKSVQLCFLISFIFLIFLKRSPQQKVEPLPSFEERHQFEDHPKRIEKNKELPGSPDLNTIFRQGVLGNYEPNSPETPGNQPGENGQEVLVTDEKGKNESKKAVNAYGFNTYVSDMISLTRTISDTRMEECKYWKYPEHLPTVSVVIIFHNEGWSPLLRTVHSVLKRSPPELLYEIVLVDDFSTKEHLKEKLEEYIAQFDGKARLIRTKERVGLIRARNIGARSAIGEVVVFLDAHCEVNTNWLPPLLAPIKNNRKVMTVPIIDGIEADTWKYINIYGRPDNHRSGIFEWGLLYKEEALSDQEKKNRSHDSLPFRSATHAGGLFAIDRKWFEELGYYDDELKIWGGEQYELSFKIWMCGGGILFVPCSRVGHVYRHHSPYNFGKLDERLTVPRNLRRVVKTWMGDYEKYFLIREPQMAQVDPGDLTKQFELKNSLKCKNFGWYMEKVAFNVLQSFPLLPENHVWGEARNPSTDKCLQRMGSGRLGVNKCQKWGDQILRLNLHGQLTQGEWCLTPSNNLIKYAYCARGTVNGPFRYNEQTMQIKTFDNHCITLIKNATEVLLEECKEEEEPTQMFKWTQIYL